MNPKNKDLCNKMMNITDGSGLENNHTIYTNPLKIKPYRLGWGMGTDLNRGIYIYCDIYVIHFLNNIISRNWGCSRNKECAWKNISDISQTCKHNFPGEEEFSEPETRAVRVGILYLLLRPFMIFIAFPEGIFN